MAQSAVTSVRIPADDLARLRKLAERLKVDRSTVIRRAIDAGVREILLQDALDRYQRGEGTAWFCAGQAGFNLLVFMDEMKKRGVSFRTDEELLEEQLEEFGRARRRR
jgi:predicted DNA-binding protein